MEILSNYIYIFIFITLFHVSIGNNCGSWQTYGEEKCIKILSTENFLTFDDAIKSCSHIDNSSELLTIHSNEEQDFISEYLFKTNKIVNNIWIGLRNRSKIFEWTDSSNKQYTNWKTENPNKRPDFNCVQLESDTEKWTNEPCNKNNLVVCQKLSDKTFSVILKMLIEAKEETRNKVIGIFNYVLNKNLGHFQLFTDINGNNRALVLPLSGTRHKHKFDDAVNLCKEFNSTLIEIESLEKQKLFESFMLKNILLSSIIQTFWMNGERDSSGKWKWLNSKTQFNFTNWWVNAARPISSADSNQSFVWTTSDESFGKWGNGPKTLEAYVICEHNFGF